MSQIRFSAKPYKIDNWTVLRLPKEASAQLPSRGQVMVKGTINNFAFATPLEPDGDGSHWLNIDKAMQKAAGVQVGKEASLAIEATKDWSEPPVPADWQKALDAHPKEKALWTKVTPLARWEWYRWINVSPYPETRQKHIDVSISKLSRGMRRPCCFNRNMCCVPDVSKNGVLLEPSRAVK